MWQNWVEFREKLKSSHLVDGPLILFPDRRQWQPGGGSGHQLAWIDRFLSCLQLSPLPASTDCNISFFPPKLEVSTAILLSLEGVQAALCLFTHRWIENIVPKASESPSCFWLHIKHRIREHVGKWVADWLWSLQTVWASFFPCVSSVGAFIHSGYIEAVAFNKVTRLENIWIKWHPLPWMDQIDLSW